jgi:ELWxxDGT repeat protein
MRRGLALTGWVVLAPLVVTCPPVGAAPRMVGGLYTGNGGLALAPDPATGFVHDGVMYFPATDAQQGYELWRTDGTAAGTYRLTDICPGVCDSGPSVLGFFHGRIYLTADDGEHGAALWRTDGAPGHEELVQGVCDGACFDGLQYSVLWRDALWFLVAGADGATVLWTSDLTAAGTHAVASLCAELAACGPSSFLGGPDPSGQGLLLWIYTNARVDSLHLLRTDGTPQGTVVLHRFQGPTQALPPAGPAGSPYFFLDGLDLWTSDGTLAGTHLVRSLDGMVSPVEADYLYLQSEEVVDGVWYGIFIDGEWLRSDGTADGTVVLANFGAAADAVVTHVGGAVLAIGSEGLWRAGATAATTVDVVAWLNYGLLGLVEQPQRAFFVLWGYGGGLHLWTTDGTAAGSRPVELPGYAKVDEYEISGLAGGVVLSRNGDQLWGVDATATRVEQLHDFQPANGPALTDGGAVLNGRLLFYGRSGPLTGSLFSSNGTAAGTAVVTAAADESAYPPYQPYHLFTRFGGDKVLFDSYTGLWVTDGFGHGTVSLSRRQGYAFPVDYSPVAMIGQELVFAGQQLFGPEACNLGKNEPWITDGLSMHTHQIVDLDPYYYEGGGSQCEYVPFSSNPGPGISVGSIAFFAADDLVHGRELFATDGTAAGTHLVADINPTQVPNTVTNPPGVPPLVGESSNPTDLTALGNHVVFVADDGRSGRQLWITDGTEGGTHRVSDLPPGTQGSTPHDLVTWRGALYFIAVSGAGEGLFRLDGSAAGTVLVSGLELGGLPTWATQLTVVGKRLFFTGFNESTGTELWTSEGSPETTHLVVDLRPGVRGSAPQNLAAVGGVLLFAADDGVSGLEPWRSDGTAAGTFALADIAPGEASSNPGPFWAVGDRILFGADDGEHGRQLWAVPVAEVVGDAARER